MKYRKILNGVVIGEVQIKISTEQWMLSEIRERQIPCDLTHMWSLRKKKQEKRQPQKRTINSTEQTDGLQRGGGWGVGKVGDGDEGDTCEEH